MKKKLSMILIAVMLLTACGSDSSQDLSYNVTDNSQQESVSRESMTLYMKIPQTLHPLENKEETVDSVLRLMFLPLVDIDASSKAQPSVAESWTFSADGLTLNLNLNSVRNLFMIPLPVICLRNGKENTLQRAVATGL